MCVEERRAGRAIAAVSGKRALYHRQPAHTGSQQAMHQQAHRREVKRKVALAIFVFVWGLERERRTG